MHTLATCGLCAALCAVALAMLQTQLLDRVSSRSDGCVMSAFVQLVTQAVMIMQTVRLRRGRGTTMQSWMRQIEAAAWGATLDGWNSPGSSLVPPGFAQKPRRVQVMLAGTKFVVLTTIIDSLMNKKICFPCF
jgi:hypothetical protein